MMLTIPWWGWAILSTVIALAELHAPGSYLIWIAIGAAVTAGISATSELSVSAEIGTFAVASALSCVAGYFVYRKANRRQEVGAPLNQRELLMVGSQGVVCVPFVNGRGKVRLGDSVWLAEGANLSQGTPVVVKSVRGTLVVVEAA
jgi:inner membrane protein